MTLRIPFSFTAAFIACAAWSAAAGAAPPSPAPISKSDAEFFEQKVRPLLVTHCFECHSAESKILQGGLHLDSRPGWQKGGESGQVVVPGKPDESLLVKALRYDKNEFVHMPPKGKLPEAEVAVFVEWVKRGAPDPREKPAAAAPAKRVIDIAQGKKHWAFQPLKQPTPPEVNDAAWCRTPVDRFILAELEKAGLKPNPPASDEVLSRRASFDLVGLPQSLPPSASPSSDNGGGAERQGGGEKAYEALIDKLLASPHYGERWGRHWLDLARFAESHGFEQDYDRPNAYHYRDFVIRALNDDLPYDTFVKWQIAGDEYEPENPQALMATGFLAAGVHATQITANQAEKERYDELDDMARTIGTTMLGLTVGCARCHDHKYDPITNADYFRIASTFTTTVRSDYDVNLEPAKHKAAMAQWEPKHKPLTELLEKHEREAVRPAFDQWLAARAEKRDAPTWVVPQKIEVTSAAPVKFEVQADGSVTARGTQFMPTQYKITVDTKLTGIRAVRLEAFRDDGLPKAGPGMSPTGGFQIASIKTNAVPVRKGTPVDGKIVRQTTVKGEKTAKVESEGADAWTVTAPAGANHATTFAFERPLGFEGGTKLTFTVAFGGNYGGIGRFRVALARDEKPALDADAVGEAALAAWEALAADPKKTPTKEERDALFAWFRSQDAAWRRAAAAVEASLGQKPKPEVAKVLISSEGVPAVRLHTQGPDFYEKTFVVRRGDPNQKVEEATPGFLEVLVDDRKHESDWRVPPPTGTKTTYRRRALTEWMTDVDHGAGVLLARVIVNRLWYYHFGRGLVNTPSDFGLQGDRPSHPELLDYLAGELIRGGWRLKPIHKLIMTSAVYMQTGASDPARVKADPENRLYWHKPMRRLEGEIVRDAMMASAGVLDTRMFGPGTLDPAQPRRSVYFFIKRTKLIPMMSLFDGPDTLQDLAVRPETTVAPQALMLMNSPIVRGYAASLAERIARESPSADERSRVVAAYRLTVSRAPSDDEIRDTLEFVAGQRAAYVSEGKAAEAEKLAWADFCQVLFGLNEFTYIP